MIIKLKRISIKDFKGVKSFDGLWDGKNINGYGDNATGKSTLVDAFQWVLFDKNSDGNSKFGIKPLNPDGTESHYLDTTVELVLTVDGDDVAFKKVYKEKWVRKAGEEEKEFSGHTTDYFVNDVPQSQKDYKAKVSNLVDEEVFKMLTNVMYFNSIEWRKRRDLIMSFSPNITNDKIIASDETLNPLKPLLDKKSVEDVQKEEKARRGLLNDLLKTLPARIDELSKIDYSLIDNVAKEDLNDLIKSNTLKLQDIANKKAALNSGSEIVNLELEIKKMQVERAQLSSFASPKAEKLEIIRREGSELRAKKSELHSRLSSVNDKVESLKKSISFNSDLRNKLYAEYDAEMAKIFKADNCSYCGQALPVEKVEELQKIFNAKRVASLEEITNRGKRIAAEIDLCEKDLITANESLSVVNDELAVVDNEINAKLFEYDQVYNMLDINPNQSKIDELVAKMKGLTEKLADLKTGFVVNPYEEEEENLQKEMYLLNRQLIMIDAKADNEARIEELMNERKKASSELSNSERLLALCDKFVVAKTNLLENHINDNFSLVKFKMFDIQVNGGISETCVATVDGVPFSDLNNAMKINAGLDIIKGLQKVYKIKAPIFIDNAESVTSYIDLADTQLIKLYVSEVDKKMRFEIGG